MKPVLLSLALVLCASFVVTGQQIDSDGKAIVFVYSYATTTTVTQLRKPVFMDGKEIADIRPEHYFVAVVSPGKHVFHLKNKKLGGVEKDFKAGEQYYIRIEWRKNAWTVVAAGFTLMPSENGQFDINQLKPIDRGNIKDASIVTPTL